MKIRVQSFAGLRSYTENIADGELEVKTGTTVGEVLKQLGVPPQAQKIILVNGRHAQQDQELQPDDLLVFFPPLEGG